MSFALIFVISFYFLERESKWGERKYTPDKNFYIEYTIVSSLFTRTQTSPGDGSSSLDGYIKLYSKDGKLLEKFFMEQIVNSRVNIYDDIIYATRVNSFILKLENYK
jgi:hypothetical protein